MICPDALEVFKNFNPNSNLKLISKLKRQEISETQHSDQSLQPSNQEEVQTDLWFRCPEIQEDQRKQEQEALKVEEQIQKDQDARSPYWEGRLA